MEKITIALVDDHLIVRDGMKYLLEEEKNIEIVGEGENGLEAIELVNKVKPDILLIDIRMPEMNGIDAVKIINEKETSTKCIILSMHDSEEYILQSIEAKAMGYLLKDAGKVEILKAIKNVHEGGKYYSGDISNVIINNLMKKSFPNPIPNAEASVESKTNSLEKEFHLTKKEIKILDLILAGRTNIEIAEELNNSKRTVETHRFNLMKKMNVKNLIELSDTAKKYSFR